MDKEERNDTLEFHLKLLTKTIDAEQYPFTKMIIEKEITKKEYEELMQLIQSLNSKHMSQKAKGYLDYSPLLIHFAGMLNIKLDPNATIYALKQEGFYTTLMDEFINILNQIKRF